MKISPEQVVLAAAKGGLIKASDLEALGIPSINLTRLVRKGALERLSRGLYAPAARDLTQHNSLAEVATIYPKVVFCLLTSLRFYDLTTQSPHEVWLAIPNKHRAPKLEYPPLRVTRFSTMGLELGVDELEVDGVAIRITNVSRTLVDCFKFRNKIGLDLALEVLQEAHRGNQLNMEELWGYAKAFRVANVMRPYLQGLWEWRGRCRANPFTCTPAAFN